MGPGGPRPRCFTPTGLCGTRRAPGLPQEGPVSEKKRVYGGFLGGSGKNEVGLGETSCAAPWKRRAQGSVGPSPKGPKGAGGGAIFPPSRGIRMAGGEKDGLGVWCRSGVGKRGRSNWLPRAVRSHWDPFGFCLGQRFGWGSPQGVLERFDGSPVLVGDSWVRGRVPPLPFLLIAAVLVFTAVPRGDRRAAGHVAALQPSSGRSFPRAGRPGSNPRLRVWLFESGSRFGGGTNNWPFRGGQGPSLGGVYPWGGPAFACANVFDDAGTGF